jgi:hypothetical protein
MLPNSDFVAFASLQYRRCSALSCKFFRNPGDRDIPDARVQRSL